MTILLIALVHGVPVYLAALLSKRVLYLNLSAVAMLLVAVIMGRPIYFVADLLAIGVAYWMGLREVRPKSLELKAGEAPSDLLDADGAAFVSGLRRIFGNLDDNGLLMVAVAYKTMAIIARVIEESPKADGPKTLDELIRSCDPFRNNFPNEIAERRRFWFTISGLLLRLEQIAKDRSDANDLCVDVWIDLVLASRKSAAVLANNKIWDDEEKELFTLGGLFGCSPKKMMQITYSTHMPEFVREHKRMPKLYGAILHDRTEDEWQRWREAFKSERAS